jgi:hypothetical protein
MNLLVDTLPSSVTIGGVEYPINADFKTCLRVILAFEDDTLTNAEKQMVLLANLYPTVPDDMRGAIEQANIFLNGGKENAGNETGPRLYSFSKDANYIFAAFKQTHGINLQEARLHWFEFLALFLDLGQDTTFCQLVSLRSRVKNGRASKEERQAAREMGDMFSVPETDDRTLEEREAEVRFMELIQGKK